MKKKAREKGRNSNRSFLAPNRELFLRKENEEQKEVKNRQYIIDETYKCARQ